MADLVFRAVPAEIEIRGLRVAGSTPDAPPFLEIPSARIQPSLAPVRGNRIVLSRVRLEGSVCGSEASRIPPRDPAATTFRGSGEAGAGDGAFRWASSGW